VITDGFYEWAGPKEARQPYWFHRPDHGLVMLAGMWKWQPVADGLTQAFVILTTRANAVVAPIHDRMPVVLDESHLDEWMSDRAEPSPRRSLLAPAPRDWLIAEQASPLVNSLKNDGPELLSGLLD
jgi:putative SOS response-associated peptidase YedK